MADIGDLIQSADVYECFDSNTVEVEIMLDYLTSQRLTPRHIYREVCGSISSLFYLAYAFAHDLDRDSYPVSAQGFYTSR
jgi:hypothetical protein